MGRNWCGYLSMLDRHDPRKLTPDLFDTHLDVTDVRHRICSGVSPHPVRVWRVTDPVTGLFGSPLQFAEPPDRLSIGKRHSITSGMNLSDVLQNVI